MLADKLFRDAYAFAKHLRTLHSRRRKSKAEHLSTRRQRSSLVPDHRDRILKKTASQCHLCGGPIKPTEAWTADHVLAHAHGGSSSIDNYLPAHALCNNYRWHYGPEEFQWILKLGVWFRSRIAADDNAALELANRFVRYEAVRASRGKADR
jgi:5-methylcytosine-specific restriction endonuclease McrA